MVVFTGDTIVVMEAGVVEVVEGAGVGGWGLKPTHWWHWDFSSFDMMVFSSPRKISLLNELLEKRNEKNYSINTRKRKKIWSVI